MRMREFGAVRGRQRAADLKPMTIGKIPGWRLATPYSARKRYLIRRLRSSFPVRPRKRFNIGLVFLYRLGLTLWGNVPECGARGYTKRKGLSTKQYC